METVDESDAHRDPVPMQQKTKRIDQQAIVFFCAAVSMAIAADLSRDVYRLHGL